MLLSHSSSLNPQGAPPRGRQLYFTFPSAPDPLLKASKAPFLTLIVATPSGAPRQAPSDVVQEIMTRGVGLVASMSFALGLPAVVALTSSLAKHSSPLDRCGL